MFDLIEKWIPNHYIIKNALIKDIHHIQQKIIAFKEQETKQTSQQANNRKPKCSNGNACWYLKQGRCWFFHEQIPDQDCNMIANINNTSHSHATKINPSGNKYASKSNVNPNPKSRASAKANTITNTKPKSNPNPKTKINDNNKKDNKKHKNIAYAGNINTRKKKKGKTKRQRRRKKKQNIGPLLQSLKEKSSEYEHSATNKENHGTVVEEADLSNEKDCDCSIEDKIMAKTYNSSDESEQNDAKQQLSMNPKTNKDQPNYSDCDSNFFLTLQESVARQELSDELDRMKTMEIFNKYGNPFFGNNLMF